MPTINGRVSHWFTELPQLRDPLPGDVDADVCIVGAGYTGLWTAYYLKAAAPHLRITVVEERFAGFGASGRNGGWLSGLAPGHRGLLAKAHGRDAVVAWQRLLNEAIDEVIEVTRRENIDADIVKGGTLEIARNAPQAQRLRAEVEADRGWGNTDAVLLDRAEALQRISVDDMVAAAFTPHCARIQPAKLVRGLADAVQRMGVSVYEQTRVSEISVGRATTPHGVVRAPVVLRATEGFTTNLPGLKRRWLPMNSAMIATEPLDAQAWAQIGWQGYETLGDTAHGFFYAQRTADDRVAIGGRAVPYRFASRIDRDGEVPAATVEYLTGVLNTLLPPTRGVGIAHGWCGVLAVPRDWTAGVQFDRASGLGSAGGYVGHGVTATNLAGQTLADLVLRADSELTRMPWVGHQSKTWEPEPLRWMGVRGMYQAYKVADAHETRRATTSPVAVVADRIAGRP